MVNKTTYDLERMFFLFECHSNLELSGLILMVTHEL